MVIDSPENRIVPGEIGAWVNIAGLISPGMIRLTTCGPGPVLTKEAVDAKIGWEIGYELDGLECPLG